MRTTVPPVHHEDNQCVMERPVVNDAPPPSWPTRSTPKKFVTLSSCTLVSRGDETTRLGVSLRLLARARLSNALRDTRSQLNPSAGIGCSWFARDSVALGVI